MFPLSFKILRYNFFVNAFVTYLVLPANVTRFSLSAATVTALNNFLSDWNTKFAAYVSPLTNGRNTVDAINAAYISGFSLTQSIRGIIKNLTGITLTSEERTILNIKRPDAAHSPSGVPKNAPCLTCISLTSLVAKILALNTDNLYKKGRPHGIALYGIKMAIVNAGDPPPADRDYQRQEDETITDFDMLFTSADVGKTAYVIAFYINTRNEAGPDSMPYIFTII